ncbi:hypothetical protein, partial [Asanoa sp. NPDC050611]|uniref:hypothetical protein n=1 Tax=Asanoa sp. NPDC050611 TaxID=3157098 RepID=UPI0033E9689D
RIVPASSSTEALQRNTRQRVREAGPREARRHEARPRRGPDRVVHRRKLWRQPPVSLVGRCRHWHPPAARARHWR